MDIRKGMVQRITKLKTYCFIDASNLFYGGVKELGWKVDYKKLIKHLKEKYNTTNVLYYGGIDTCGFSYATLPTKDFPIELLISYLSKLKDEQSIMALKRARFYSKLKSFGYELKLKPLKFIREISGTIKKKANCDVDLTFDAMRLKDEFNSFVLLSGDGDFIKLLLYFREQGKQVHIIANQNRTAFEIKKIFWKEFTAVERFKDSVEYKN